MVRYGQGLDTSPQLGPPPRFARPRRRFRPVFPYSFGWFCCCWMVLFSCNFRLCINAKETSCFFSSRSFTFICFSLLLGSQLGRFYPKKINFSGIGRIWPRSRRDEKGLFHRFSPFVRQQPVESHFSGIGTPLFLFSLLTFVCLFVFFRATFVYALYLRGDNVFPLSDRRLKSNSSRASSIPKVVQWLSI